MRMKSPTPLQNCIYKWVARIPTGNVVTYGQLAALAGKPRAARMVGTTMRDTPPWLDIPCHRVVKAKGGLADGAIFGGEANQRAKLFSEGVHFLDNGNVDLRRSQWQTDP